ncbi:MAG: peptidoglycan editing factor PgeF [Sulfuriflexus sp.]|nr:peptidoglycan editing factor PgeF [Sulfuriflexus sp.]
MTIIKSESIIIPDWPAPARVKALTTTRMGGNGQTPYDSLNLAQHVGDSPTDVSTNREHLKQLAGYSTEPTWLEQVHGKIVMNANNASSSIVADASFSITSNKVCVVMTADCLPVLFCDKQGRAVAAAHAGWRGLANGVLEATLKQLCDELACSSGEILAWLGPAIGPSAFEVGDEVRKAFIAQHDVASAFVAVDEGHWLMDIYAVARVRLNAVGVTDISGGEYCTFNDSERFFSYRRDKSCGRMASLIWLQD